MQHKEQEFAMANEAMLAEFMERIDQIADVVGQQELGPDGSDCAGKLRLAVDDLRDVSCLLDLLQQWS
jgi:microsomal dipeptidase-like Zn-dependent dipeptidase